MLTEVTIEGSEGRSGRPRVTGVGGSIDAGWVNSLEWRFKSCTERGSVRVVLAVCRKEFKRPPELESKGRFIREGEMLHRQSMVILSEVENERA